ncbi:MAG: methylenetetrahydrofolate reductase [Desulfobacterales bacterium]|nr:methylenetetrahydrofolate reductase [Desulfobacterales bacterium]
MLGQKIVNRDGFRIAIEVVPPAGPDAVPLLTALASLAPLELDGFSVATNPVAKPRMSAMALCSLIQQQTGRPAVLHCTSRDHNRLSLQGLLWGARALGIETVLITTGDYVALKDRIATTDVRDADTFGLVAMAREAGLCAGVVFDPFVVTDGLDRAVERLDQKVQAGAQFVVTQPAYDEAGADLLAEATARCGLPVVMGILPLRTPKHADFLHDKVAGIVVPESVRQSMHMAADPVAQGNRNARHVLTLARERFAGACIMPPFDHYETLFDILGEPPDGPDA